MEIRAGNHFERFVLLHDNFVTIPAGETRIKILWYLAQPDPAARVYVSFPMVVNVLPASPERLPGVVRQLIQWAKVQTARDPDGFNAGYRHHVFQRSMMPLIRSTGLPAWCKGIMVDHLLALPRADYAQLAAEQVLGPELAARPFQMRSLRQHGQLLSPKEAAGVYERLADVWLRAHFYVIYHEALPETAKKALLKEFEEVMAPLDATQFATLVRQLDSPHFQDREKASKELIDLGDKCFASLKKLDQEKLSPEAQRRVAALIKEIPSRPHDSLAESTLKVLADYYTPVAREFLQAIADNADGSWMRARATELLAKSNADSAKEKK